MRARNHRSGSSGLGVPRQEVGDRALAVSLPVPPTQEHEVPTVFTRIIDGELPGTFVWRDDDVVAFLSINPVAEGHVLVVPRLEVDHWVDLAPEVWNRCCDVARRVGRGIQAAFDPPRVGVVVEGFEVPHVHLHVAPIAPKRKLNFAHAASHVDPDELARAGAAIRDALDGLGEAHGC